MKAARDYIKGLRNALRCWTEWIEDGNKLLSDGEKDLLQRWIDVRYMKLSKMDAEDAKDAICQHPDSIELNLNRLIEYGLEDIVKYFVDINGIQAELNDDEVNVRIDDFLRLVERKINDILRVYQECERYIKPSDPVIEKALKDTNLLFYFHNNKKELTSYIKYCRCARTPTEMAKRVVILSTEGKISREHINKRLFEALKNIGVEVGKYNNWKAATRTITQLL